ncbi:MAG: ABC transporter permease subunit [Actinobacteria bacterium]|nr:ABC transporter permease subunit [Actinomycetota bacterium]
MRSEGVASEAGSPRDVEPADPVGAITKRVTAAIPSFIVAVIVIGGWEAAARAELVNRLIVPAPTKIFSAFVELFSSGLVWEHLRATVFATTAGFALGSGAAFIIGVLCSFWRPFRKVVEPYMITLQVTPRVALAPLFVTWLGFGLSPKIVMAATICFFPVFVNTLTGLLTTDEEALEMLRSMGATKRQTFTQFTLPSALPIIFAGLKTAMTLALIGALVAEFVGTSQGLGLLIDRFTFRLAMEESFAVLLTLALLGLFLYGLMEWLDRRVVYWTHEERLSRREMRSRLRSGRERR